MKNLSIKTTFAFLLALTVLPACTQTELTNASAASARNWCHHTPEKCTVEQSQK